MTPLDLSIDLGRKDIAFLLLSMRGSGGSAGAPPPAAKAAEAAAAKPGKPQTAERRHAATVPVAPLRSHRRRVSLRATAARPCQARFLGFDANGRGPR